MLHIHKPSRSTRFKRWLRRLHIAAWAGAWRGWHKTCKQIHTLPETKEPVQR